MQVQSVSAPSSAPAPVLSLFVSAEAGDDSDPQCGLKRSAPCQSISRALSKFPQEVWLLGGTYNASEVSVQSATPQQLLRVQDPLSNFIAINGLMDAALACRANQAAPDPTAANSGEFLFVDQGSELFLSNVRLVLGEIRFLVVVVPCLHQAPDADRVLHVSFMGFALSFSLRDCLDAAGTLRFHNQGVGFVCSFDTKLFYLHGVLTFIIFEPARVTGCDC